MTNFIIFGDFDSRKYNAYVFNISRNDAPRRSVKRTYVPNKNGALHIDNGYFENIVQKYAVIVKCDSWMFDQLTDEIKRILFCDTTAKRLYDSKKNGTFRMAVVNNGFELLRKSSDNSMFRFDVSFDCAPQNFLEIGESPISVHENGGLIFEIENPTCNDAHPIIKFMVAESDGQIRLGDSIITYTGLSVGDSVVIDEDMFATANSISVNEKFSISQEILLRKNEKTAIFHVGVQNLEIIPRWWTL